MAAIIEELNSIAAFLPLAVLQDINQRITDWLASGGSLEDYYIKQQLRFAKRFVKNVQGEKSVLVDLLPSRETGNV